MKCFGCSQYIVSKKICSLCDNFFCSDSCIEVHQITYHRISKMIKNRDLDKPIITKTPDVNSKFITEGKIFQKIEYNKIYSLNNFIQILAKNNKPFIIGSGSYGKVYLCKNIINNKYYAIKHMDKARLKKALKTLSGIYTEIDLQSKISHPNIIQLLYVHESKTKFDLVMEYASKGSLFDFIRKNRHLSEDLSFSIFIQVVNAVYFLHKNDLIHRDIKPENLLLFDKNLVKLCDFGWCVSLNGGQRGTFCGTTEYMAPEMVNKKEYSKEIDIWSLGVLLYEMVHGHSPFIPHKANFNEKEVMENIKIHNLKFDENISYECRDLICHLLDENISKRYKIEDIFNSDFVKRYENNENLSDKKKTIEDDFNNMHAKCFSNFDYCYDKIKSNNEIKILNKKNNLNNENINNKTANNFYPKNYKSINIEISKKIEINNESNSPVNNSPEKYKLIKKDKLNVKVKNDERKNGFKIFDKAIEYLNLKELKQKNNTNIINMDVKEANKDFKIMNKENITNLNKNNEEDELNKNSNYSNSEGNNNNIYTLIKKHPVNSGNSMINSNSKNNTYNSIKKISAKNKKIIINHKNNEKIKNKSLISYKSNGEYLISPKNNTPIIIKTTDNIKKSNKNNIKQKFKIFSKNNSSNAFKINNDLSNQSMNNKTQIFQMKNNNSLLKDNSKMRNYSDINYNSFKDTPDPEFFIQINDSKKAFPNISDSKKVDYMKDNSESRVYQNFNYLIINNSNNIISSSLNQRQKNERMNKNKDNNIIIYPYNKTSKTPIKNKARQKQTIKIEKRTLDYENDSKLHRHKIRIKSKSQIKKVPEQINNMNLNIQNKLEQKNDMIINQKNTKEKNNIRNLIYNKEKEEKPTLIDTILNENTVNQNTINECEKVFKRNNIEIKKINKLKNEKEDSKNIQINNNSFIGGTVKKLNLENNKQIITTINIKNYNNKKNFNEQKKDASVTLSEYSKIIDEREYDVEDNEEDELESTPKKTTDKLKIFPCKLISELNKK